MSKELFSRSLAFFLNNEISENKVIFPSWIIEFNWISLWAQSLQPTNQKNKQKLDK